MTALDTNVVITLDEGQSNSVEPTLAAIEEGARGGRVVICAAVYSELFGRNEDRDDVDEMLRSAQIAVDFSLAADVWIAAGLAYGAYHKRRRSSGGGHPRRILADFLIGAHARTIGALVTRDGAFYRRAFPGLRVIEVR